jgi:membrane protein implicated in regulation of membrane protease activity
VAVKREGNTGSRSFFQASRDQWLAVGFLVITGPLMVFGGRWLGDHLTDPQQRLVTIAVLVLAPFLQSWADERAMLRSGASSPFALLRGRRGTVTASCNPKGLVILDGTIWQAESLDAPELRPGESVFVHTGEGLVLAVSRAAPST